MINVMVICGGESGEHEVSLQSASSVIRYLPKDTHTVIPVGIQKDGRWVSGDSLILDEDDPVNIRLNPALTEATFHNGYLNDVKVDVAFSVIHGTYGEDGSLQGFFNIHHTPCVGAGVLGSAVGMDKDIMKRLLLHSGINCAKGVVIHAREAKKKSYKEIQSILGDEIFIKPCNLGSSVGVSKCRNEEEYQTALAVALQYDQKVIVEEAIRGREVEVAVLGDINPRASEVGEIRTSTDFYSYEAKYINDQATELDIPADLPVKIKQKIQEVAVKVFQTLECSGMGRVDFFLTSENTIYVNEINTLPGFTKISMYPKLWEYSGVTYPELLTQLIQMALERYKRERQLVRSRA